MLAVSTQSTADLRVVKAQPSHQFTIEFVHSAHAQTTTRKTETATVSYKYKTSDAFSYSSRLQPAKDGCKLVRTFMALLFKMEGDCFTLTTITLSIFIFDKARTVCLACPVRAPLLYILPLW